VDVARRTAKRIPGLRRLYRWFRDYNLRRANTEVVFTDIYEHNRWGGTASVSGSGSAHAQTAVVVRELPVLFRDLGVSTVLDIPCGDFNWMKDVSLAGIDYIGGDIVRELVQRNQETSARAGIAFRHLNLLVDSLPRADVILCRDCLVHFSYADIFRALRHFIDSGSGYLLTTTFTARKDNRDILTGKWRPLNLERPPFSFPQPLRLIVEECTEGGGAYRDKALGLWSIAQVANVSAHHARRVGHET
jgi:SAM-dependent methyltransferase